MAALSTSGITCYCVLASSANPLPRCSELRLRLNPRGMAAHRHTALPRLAQRQQRATRVTQRRRAASVVVAETQYLAGAENAKALVDQGYTVVDVRDPTQWDKSRIVGSVHIPFFIVNEDSDLKTMVLRQAHNNFAGNLYGLAFTKPNPNFRSEVQKKFPDKASKLLLVCQEGLRSNSAGDELEDLGYTNLAILERGLNKVAPGVLPKEGPRELKDAGKGGFVAIQTQFSIVLGTILICAILFLQFFPEASQKLLGGL